MAENKEIVINVKAGPSIKDLKQELLSVKNELLSLDPASEGFSKAAARAGALKDQIDDTNESIKELASGSKLEQFGNVLGSIKDKILSLDFEGAKEKAKQLAEISKNFSVKDAIQSVKDLGGTFVQLGKALLTNPLFLIAGAIAAAVYAFSQMPSEAEKTAKEVEKLNTQLELSVYYLEEANKKREVSRNEELEIAKIRGKSNEDILRLQQEQNKARIEENKHILEKKREELANLQIAMEQSDAQGRRTGDYKIYNEQLEQNNKLVDELNALELEQKKIVSDIRLDEERISAERRKQADKLAKDAEQAFKEQAAKAKEQYEKDVEAWKKAQEEKRRIAEESERLRADFNKQKSVERQISDRKEIEENLENNQMLLDGLLQQQRDANVKKLEEDQAAELKKKELADKAYAQQVEDTNKRIDREKELREKQKELAANAISIISELGSLFAQKNEKDAKKAFEINKAFSLSTAIANTGLAIINALTAGGNPIKLATGAQFVDAAIAGTIGAINIAKIAATKFESKGSSSSSSSSSTNASIATPATPNLQLFGTAGAFNNGGSSQSTNNQQPIIQAVVSESDITQTVQRVANYRTAAEL